MNNLIGGKARGLQIIERAGHLTPPWICIKLTHFKDFLNGFTKSETEDLEKLRKARISSKKRKQIERDFLKKPLPSQTVREIDSAFEKVSGKHGVAVRSSCTGEDGQTSSFAGQFKTTLFVDTKEDCYNALKMTWLSTFHYSPNQYNKVRRKSINVLTMAVIIQKMLNPQVSGVLFSKDPITGESKIVISSTKGTAEKLVSGEEEGETIIATDTIIPSSKYLKKNQITQLVSASKSLENHTNKPVDIEWVFVKGKLYVLQTRPITTIRTDLTLWSNANIIESYYGPTTPLTFGVASEAYYHVYKQFCQVVGVPKRIVEANDPTFRNMIGFIDNRVYYNLTNWYRLLTFLPQQKRTGTYMENMMGVRTGYKPSQSRVNWSSYEKVKQAVLITYYWLSIGKQVRKFESRFEQLYKEYNLLDMANMNGKELFVIYKDIRERVIGAWKAPIINDFLAMTFYGLMATDISDGKISQGQYHNMIATEDVLSTGPARLMQTMSHHFSKDSLRNEHNNTRVARDLIKRPSGDALGDLFKQFIQEFGDRCPDEQKMESESYKDKPDKIIQILRMYTHKGESRHAGSNRRVANSKMSLRSMWVTSQAKKHMRFRENMRLKRSHIFGVLRNLFREMGKHLEKQGLLDDKKDIYFLDTGEIEKMIKSGKMFARKTISDRKRALEKSRLASPPDRFFTTPDMKRIVSSFSQIKSDGSLGGIGCSAGEVKAQVVVMKDLDLSKDVRGKIIVTERTDPSWAAILPLCKGLIVERGSVLSHSGIIARELGIPAILSVQNATSILRDNMMIAMNGSTGEIRLCK